MTQDDIIRMAKTCHIHIPDVMYADEVTFKQLECFANLVAAHEREACAKVCDEFESDADPDASTVLAAAIRARGETK